MRDKGYYWVKRFDEWTIARFNGLSWVSAEYTDMPLRDDDLQLISENRIEEPALVRLDKKRKK